MLQENEKMFDETLNIYPHKEVHINKTYAFHASPSTLNLFEDFQKKPEYAGTATHIN